MLKNGSFLCLFCACKKRVSASVSLPISLILSPLSPLSYHIPSLCLTLSLSVDVFAFFFLQNPHVFPKCSPSVWGWTESESHTQSVSEQAFPLGRKSMTYPWRMEWRLLTFWSCPVHPGRSQGRRHLALKVVWVLEGRAQDGVHSNVLRGHQRQVDSNGHQQRVAESIMVPPQLIMSFTHCVAL